MTSNARYRQLVNTLMLMNTLAILRVTFGNFRTVSVTISACVNLHIDLLLITSNPRYLQLVNTIMLMTTLAILRGTFGNFLILSLTTSASVNLNTNLLLMASNARYRQPCEHFNVNEHPRNPSGYFR